MNRAIIIGCSIFSVLIIVVALFCGGLSFWGASKYMANNTTIIEGMTGNKIPKGFIPIIAINAPQDENSNNPGKFAVLAFKFTQFVMLAESHNIDDSQKEKVLHSLQESESNNEEFDIQKIGTIKVANKILPKYQIIPVSEQDQTKGMATFIDYPQRTLVVIYFADLNYYDENSVMLFLKAIKLP